MDPLSSAQVIFDISYKIYSQVELVNINQEQCRYLAQKVQMISNTIRNLVNNHQKTPAPIGAAVPIAVAGKGKVQQPFVEEKVSIEPATSLENRYFIGGFAALKETLNDALALVSSFSQKSWFKMVVRAGTDSEKFSAIYARLEENISHLSLGINVQNLMDKKEEKEAIRKDWQVIQSKQAEILRLNQEAKQETQQLALDESTRHEVLLQQLQSMKLALQEIGQGKQNKGPLPKKLLVPFHELSVDGLIDKGTFGEVYKGRWLEHEVAIKMLKGKLTTAQEEEFIREVKIMKRLRSEYVMQLDAVCFEPGRACIVMKHMKGGTLTNYLANHRLTPMQKHQLALDIALGLHYLHEKNIIHRDLKGTNILIDDWGSPRISDYGIAKVNGVSSILTIQQQNPSIDWLAPEVVEGTKAHTQATDIYSYGTLLWHIMTEKIPYQGLSKAAIVLKLAKFEVETIPATLPAVYQEIIASCWQRDPNQRPALVTIIQKLRNSPPPAEDALVASDPETFYHAGLGYEYLKQYDKAFESYKKAAALGHIKAKTNLGCFYSSGQGGIPQDKAKAHALFLEAATGGHSRAMHNLAKQFSQGDGVAKDEAQAKYWLQQAQGAIS